MIGPQYGILSQFRLAKKLEEEAKKRREKEKAEKEKKEKGD